MDTFAFRQGFHRGVNTGRAFIHGAADVFTLGLREVIATPMEIALRGMDMRFEVTDDENDRVTSTKRLNKAVTTPGPTEHRSREVSVSAIDARTCSTRRLTRAGY